MDLRLERMTQSGFEIEPALVEGALKLKLKGTGDSEAVMPLTSTLAAVRAEMMRLDLRRFELDVSSLYLLNSRCLKALVSFIYQVQTSSQQQFKIQFLVTPRLSWQRRALAALERMAPLLVSISDEASA